jgi:hypothetical protein
VPALTREQPQITLISELGIGDRDLAFQCGKAGFFVGIVGARDLFIEQFIDLGVDAADKEARHACDPRNLAAFGGKRFEGGQIGLDDLFVELLGKQ